jgi:3-hydroxyacyl-CoA dehydrogenase
MRRKSMKLRIQRAAVIGSGTMGGGIAALLAGLGIPTLLFDIVPGELTPLEEAEGLTLEDSQVRNRIVNTGWKAVTKSRPPAVLSESSQHLVTLLNLEDDFDQLAGVDLIIEVIVENLKIKQELFKKIDDIRAEHTIIATNTSGLPIKALVKGMSKGFQGHFLGMHFFNPPRWLKLLEVIPHEGTLPEVLEFVVSFSEDVLGKGVVVCKDTPNFIANRMFSITNANEVAYGLDHGYGIEEIDTIMGELVGRPKTAIFRLRDLIGNDVAAHVGSNLYELIDGDETRDVLIHEASVKMLGGMVERKWFGNKTKVGFYKRVDQEDGSKEFWILNPDTMEHEAPSKPRFAIFKAGRDVDDLGERFAWFRDQTTSEEADEETQRLAKYIYETTLFSLGYASRRVPEIADRFLDIDLAMKWGFANEIGPFEIWDGLGVEETLKAMEAREIEVGPWVGEMLNAGCKSFYQRKKDEVIGYYDLGSKSYLPLKTDDRILPIDQLKAKKGAILKRNASASLINMGDGVGLVEFHSKANALDQDIFDLMTYALDQAEADVFDALVIGNEGKHYSAGANVFLIWMAAQAEDFEQIDQMIAALQHILMRVRYFPKPIVAAPHGMVLGGGAELSMACAKRVAAAETFIGLVEMGVGVVPAGTGTKEMIRRVINPVMRVKNADPNTVVGKVFEQIAMANVATGAWEAFEMGFFQPGDRIIMKKEHLLAEAKRSALAMVKEGYKPPPQERIYVAGRDVFSTMKAVIWDLHERGWASEHDALIASQIAWILSGGDITDPAWVSEQYLLDLERKAFIRLCHEQKTIDRLGYMLEHNKPLRN